MMDDKTDGKVFWETKDGDRRLMVSWQAKKGETKTPIPQVEAKIIPLMLKMKVDEANVKFDLVSGNPRNIEFVDAQAADEAKKKVEEQAKIQQKNAEEFEQSVKPIEEKTATMEKPINTNYSKDFHNPYNFVPAIPRKSATGELADREPIGHDRYYPNHLSGKLTVKMTVETPLVVLDTARMTYESTNKHKSYPVRIENGKPFINPTAVKGMLRSAYEAVTNSRMSVFTKHEDRLAFRPEAGQGAFVVPVRIEEDNNVKKIVFYTGTNEIADLKNDGSPQNDKPLCAAWLPRYRKNGNSQITTYNDGSLPQHKAEVKVYVEKFEHYRWKKRERVLSQYPDFVFWRVRNVVKESETLGTKPNATTEITRVEAERKQRSYYRPLGVVEEVGGIVFISNHNMQSKHDEKVFFKNSNSPTPEILDEKKWGDLKKSWKELLENYRAEHEKVKGKLEPVPGNLRIDEWSRHIQLSEKEKELKPDIICFAEVEKIGSIFTVKRLFPVMISRQLFESPPDSLLGECLKPATEIDKLSPADRVFGWVKQKGSGSYRGQIRIGSITTKETNAIQPFNDLPLNILGQPKPQQGRFYVAKDKDGNAQTVQGNNEASGYNDETKKGLRGRKVYPHHANLPKKDYWFEQDNINFSDKNLTQQEVKPNYFREYLRPFITANKQKDSQNRSIEGWIKPQTEFEFDGTKADIRKGKDLMKRYLSLDDECEGKLDNDEIEKLATDFESLVNQTFPTILKSFKAACKGFADKPTHYPRVTKKPLDFDNNGKETSESFKWFVANNKGSKLPLPNLSNEIGLPREPTN